MTIRQELLKEFQKKTFGSRTLNESFRGFDYRAYPETATGINLDSIAQAIKVTPRTVSKGKPEECESFRKRILIALETEDDPPGEDDSEAA